MQVQITDDWVEGEGRSMVIDLDELIMNFASSDALNAGDEIDMRRELELRGWYEGACEFGRYLVLNLARLSLEQRKTEKA